MAVNPDDYSIDQFLAASSSSPFGNDGPLDLSTCYSKDVITKLWIPRVNAYPTSIPEGEIIPATHKWTTKELIRFKLHFFTIWRPVNVTPYWHEYLCPPIEMGERAKMLSACPFSTGDILSKKIWTAPDYAGTVPGEFCELLYTSMISTSSENAIDDLVKFLLRKINPSTGELVVIGQQAEITVVVGDTEFKSIPDVSVIMSPDPATIAPRASLIVVEDKKSRSAAANAEFQLAGEMLATAYLNYYGRGITFDQTIFAVRVVGTAFSFYRAEFSKSYIISLAKGLPTEHVTIFRLGAGNGIQIGNAVNSGVDDRMIVMHILTSMLHAVQGLAVAWDQKKVAPITSDRLAKLSDTR